MKVDEIKIREALLLISRITEDDIILTHGKTPQNDDLYLVAMPNGYEGKKRKTEYMIRTELPGHLGDGFSFASLPDALHFFKMCEKIGVALTAKLPEDFEAWLEKIHAGFYRSDDEFKHEAVATYANKESSEKKAVAKAVDGLLKSVGKMKAPGRYEEVMGQLVKIL